MSEYLKKLLDKRDFSIAHALQAIEAGEDPNTPNSLGESLLHLIVARESNNHDTLRKLVTLYNADIHKKNGKNQTPLQQLIDQDAWSGNDALFLVSLGADPNTKDSKEEPLIHKLALRSNTGCWTPLSKLVNKYKVDINTLNPHMKTPLQCILEQQYVDEFIAIQLIELGADPNTQDKKQNSLIYTLVTSSYIDAVRKTYIEKLVHDYQVDINAIHPKSKKTPLQVLLNKGTTEMNTLLFLFSCGAHPDTVAENGQNIIHTLVLKDTKLSAGDNNALKKLERKYHANFNAKDNQGKTPFQYALDRVYSYDDLDMLLSRGCNPDTQSSVGNSVLHRLMRETGDESSTIKSFIINYPSMLLVKNKNGDTPFACAMRFLKMGFGEPVNIIPIVENSPDFINRLKTAFNSPAKNIADINSIFTIVHKRKRNHSFELQGIIRNMAFAAFVESLEALDDHHKLSRLKWARTQTIFKEHRSYSFFASIGRTNTVVQIDQMIDDIETQIAQTALVAKKNK